MNFFPTAPPESLAVGDIASDAAQGARFDGRFPAALFALAMVLLAPVTASAQTLYWDPSGTKGTGSGGAGTWATGGSAYWAVGTTAADTVWTSGYTAEFAGGNTATGNSVTLNSTQTVAGLIFAQTVGSYAIGGTGTIAFTTGGTNSLGENVIEYGSASTATLNESINTAITGSNGLYFGPTTGTLGGTAQQLNFILAGTNTGLAGTTATVDNSVFLGTIYLQLVNSSSLGTIQNLNIISGAGTIQSGSTKYGGPQVYLGTSSSTSATTFNFNLNYSGTAAAVVYGGLKYNSTLNGNITFGNVGGSFRDSVANTTTYLNGGTITNSNATTSTNSNFGFATGNGVHTSAFSVGDLIEDDPLNSNYKVQVTIQATGSGDGSAGIVYLLNTNNSYSGPTIIDQGIMNVASLANGSMNSSIGASSNSASNLVLFGAINDIQYNSTYGSNNGYENYSGELQYTGSTAQSTDRLFQIGDNGANGSTNSYNNAVIDASGGTGATVTFTNTGAIALGSSGVNLSNYILVLTGTNTGANTLDPLLTDYNSTYTTSLLKEGTGTWVLNNAETYSGGTTIVAGTLVIGSGGSLNPAGAVTINSGATLDLSEATGQTLTSLSGPGGVALGNTALTLTPSAATTFSGSLQDGGLSGATGGSLIKVGTGTLVLSGANTYTGGTNVNNGTLQITGSLSSAGALNFGGTGTANFNEASGASQSMGTLSFNSGYGTVQNTNTSTGVTLTFANVAPRSVGATGNFVSSGSSNQIALTNFNSATTPTGTLLDPGLFYNGSSYAAYDVGGFVRAYGLGDANYAPASAGPTMGSVTSSSNVALSGNITAQTSATINTLNMGANSLTLGSGQTLKTAGILSSGSSSATFSGGNLQAASPGGELVINVNNSSDQLTIGSTLQDNTAASTLTKTGYGTLVLNGVNTYTGATYIDSGLLTLGNASALSAAAVTVGSGGALDLAGQTISSSALTLNGTGISSGGALTNSSSTAVAITASGTTLASSAAIGGNAGGIAINSAIGDGGNGYTLAKVGTNTVTLNGANTYSGGTIVSAGTLLLANASALGSGAVSVTSGAALDLGGQTVTGLTTSPLTLNGTASSTVGALTNSSSTAATISVSGTTLGSATSIGGNAGNITLSGVVSGANSLTKVGSDTVTLSSANTYTGGTIISGGTLALSTAGRIYNGTTGTLVDNGVFDISASATQTIGGLSGNGTINLGAFTLSANADGSSTTFAGSINGTGGFGKNSTGTLTLTGANSYTGATTITNGTLALSGSGSLSSSTAVSDTFNGTSSFDISQSTGNQTIGSLATTYATDSVYLGGNTLTVGGNNGVTTVTGAIKDGGIAGGTGGSLVKTGTGTMTLAGANSYTGGTTINAGTILLSNATALGTGSVTVNTNGVLSLGSQTISNAVTINGTGISSAGALINSTTGTGTISATGSVTLGSNSSIGGTTALTINGVVSDGGNSFSLTKVGAGTLTLGGADTYTGATTVSAGTLALSGSGSLSSNDAVSVTSTTAATGFDISGSTGGQTIGSLASSNATYDTVYLGSKTLTAGGNNTSTLVIGAIKDGGIGGGTGGSLVKTGTGTMTLSAANTYTGTTTVNNGTLKVTGTLNGTTGTALTFSGTSTANFNEASAATQGMGTLTFNAGYGTAQNTYTSTGDTLTFSNVATRATGATGLFYAFGGTNGTTNKIVLTKFGVSTPTAKALLDPGLFFYNGTTYSYATYDSGGFVRAYGSGDTGYVGAPTAATIGTVSSASNVTLTTGGITAQTTATINTLSLGAYNLSIAAGQTLSTAGILFTTNGTHVNATGTAPLGQLDAATGGGELIVNTATSGATMSIGANIVDNTSASVLTKTGVGTLTLTGTNTYSGATYIDAGTLSAAATTGAAMGSTSGVTVNTGGTLLFGATDQINHSAAVTLAGGTLKTGTTTGFSETAGTLTLTNNSVIDLGSTATAQTLAFANSSSSSWATGDTLSIYDYTSGTDIVSFGSSASGLTSTQLSQILFYSGAGTGLLGPAGINASGQLTVVPEPGTIFAALGLLGLIGWRERRRLELLLRGSRAWLSRERA
jgi:autotransporter-associated beta strand protein